MGWHMAHMAGMGLLVAVAAPAVTILLARFAPGADRWAVPAWAALPGFVLLHAAVTVWPDHRDHMPMGPSPHDAVPALVLLAGAVAFWAPVLGVRRRLPDAGRTLYLFTAMPLLDLAGVYRVASGDQAGGLSMIVGMLPMGLAMVVITWNWIGSEERRAALAETPAGADR